jgi:metaxin
MNIAVWQKGNGLASIDPKCLAVMTYCKFAQNSTTVQPTRNPYKYFSYTLPVLKHDKLMICGVTKIIDYLKLNSTDIDQGLPDKSQGLMGAYISMVEEKLVPALNYYFWIDARNYSDSTRPKYAKAMMFPFFFFLPFRIHNQLLSDITSSFNHNLPIEDIECKLYKDAKECLNLLSKLLGEKEFFFGTRPTTLDAVVYGYIAVLLKSTLPNEILQQHLKNCNNLVSFCERISNKYFPLTNSEKEELTNHKEKVETGESEFPNKKRNIFLASILALTTMVAYAFLSGIIVLEIVDQDSSVD